jgi:hypothetical protein
MRPITVSVGPLATASTNAIALSQTPTGALTLNGALVSGGVATLDTPRRVAIACTANESAKTFTISGTDSANSPIIELLIGGNAATVYTNMDFKTVTSITINAAAAGALTVGTNGIASSTWVRLDDYALPQVAVQCTPTGTVSYTVQQTLQDPNSATNPVAPYLVTWLNTADNSAVNATSALQTSYQYAPAFVKVTLNSGTGSVSTTITQLGVVPY